MALKRQARPWWRSGRLGSRGRLRLAYLRHRRRRPANLKVKKSAFKPGHVSESKNLSSPKEKPLGKRAENVKSFLLAFAALLSLAGVASACDAASKVESMDFFLQCAALGSGSSFARQLTVRALCSFNLCSGPCLRVGSGAQEWLSKLLGKRHPTPDEEREALMYLAQCLQQLTRGLLGRRWASLCGAQTAQGLLCEARKFFSSSRITLRTPGDPIWYKHVLDKFCQKHRLPLKVRNGRTWKHVPPKAPSTMDEGVLGQLLDLFQALVWRFCTMFCTPAAEVELRPGAESIFQMPKFRKQKLLQFNWRLDRTSLRLWEACAPHIGAQTAEWPHDNVKEYDDRQTDADFEDSPNTSVVLTTAAHVLLPCRQLGFLTPDNISHRLEQAFDGSKMRHPYGRAVDQGVKLQPTLQRFEALQKAQKAQL